MKVRVRWLVIAVFVLSSVNGFAQITGSIQGEVTDHEGQALPGVTVKLTGDPIPGAERVAVTDAQGNFRYSALPVGRYSLSASIVSFIPQEVANVRVSIDGVASVTFRMQPETFAGEIAVTGETPLVDAVSTSVTTNYDAEFVEALPTRNNFYDIISVAPAMSQPDEGSPYFSGYGGNATSEQWNIDGLNLASPEGGWLGWNINPDIVMETSLKGFGAGAEYGSTLGNVYNLVTKSGTNTFHGAVTAYLMNDSLVDPNVELDPEELHDYRLWDPAGHYTVDDYYDTRATLGGPIIRDKLWFFAAAQFQKVNIVGPSNVAGLDGTGTTTDRYDLKVTAQPGQSHRLDFRGHTATDDIVPAPTMYTDLAAVMVTDIDTTMLTGDYTWVMTDRTLLNVRAGTWNRDQNFDSRTGSDEELLQDATHEGPDLWLNGTWWFHGRKEEYTQADAVVTHFADEFFAGSHEFKFGVQYNEGLGERRSFRSSFRWKQPPSAAFYWYDYWSFRFLLDPPMVYGAETTTKAAFVEDSWQISDRLTIDVGVRYDDQEGRIPDFPKLEWWTGDETGETIPGVDMISWKNWAPRLGFAWNPKGDGKTVLRGFVGQYFDGAGSASWYAPPPERGAMQVWFVYPWQYLVSSTPSPNPQDLLDPNLKNPSAWQYGLSFDQQLGNDYAIGAQLVYKDQKNMIGWQIDDDGVCEPFFWDDPWTEEVDQIELCEVLVEPTLRKGNGPGPGSLAAPGAKYYLEYKGAILTFRKRYTNGWDLMASYTYSKTKGINPRPHDDGDLGQGLQPFTADTGSDPVDWYNSDHLLNGDRTHMFRVQSNVDIGWGLRVSGVLNIQSGRPYLRLAFINGPVTGRAITLTADKSEDLRFPSQKILDLGLQKTFGLGSNVNLDIGLQVLNVLNEDAPEYWVDWILFPGEDYEARDWVSPRRLQLKFKLAF
jgi:outer membrane receptor protein involved in Fe transport